MAANSFETLQKVIEDNSVASNFYDAVHEWSVVAVEEHPQSEGECVCGQQNLLYMYTIHNKKNQNMLRYIGSHCVHHFEREDLNVQVSVFSLLLALKKAIEEGTKITLTTDYFSRDLIDWLLDQGAFDNEYNGNNGDQDHSFFLKMFNKRKKEDISDAQRKKIWVMLQHQIKPFIRNHPALRERGRNP